MGVSFKGCNASWSFSGFNHFRSRLWTGAGFEGDFLEEAVKPCLGQITPDHPLYDFFNHSDCEGYLTPEQIDKIYPAMEMIIEQWEEWDYDRVHAEMLIDRMKNRSSKGKKLKFT